MTKSNVKKRNSLVSIVLAIALALGVLGTYFSGTGITAQAASNGGFYVDGTTIRDANGNPFVMRGINVAHAWFTSNTEESIKAVAATGSNTARIVIADGQTYAKTSADEVKKIIEWCKNNKLVCVLDVHDATGKDDVSYLDRAVDYWKEIKDILNANKQYVIVNIANEWYGTWNGSAWADGNKKAVKALRSAGIENMLLVDCAGWGQYPDSVKDYGRSVYEADPNKNLAFSIHMYEYAGGDADTVKNNIDNALGTGVPVVIGEFGSRHTNGDVDEYTIMSYCREKSVGYLGWSWKGNGETWAYLDIANDWNGSSLSDWGKTLIYDTNGIKNTSSICSIYTGNTGNNNNNNNNNNNGSDNYVSLFYGNVKSSNWGQAVTVSTKKAGGAFDANNIKSGGHFYVEYNGIRPELILQSKSGGPNWAKVSYSESGKLDNGHRYVKYSYNNCVKAFGSNFGGLLDAVHVGATDKEVTVYSLCYDFGKTESSNNSNNNSNNNNSNNTSNNNYVSAFWGNSSANQWKQAVSVMTTKNGGKFDANKISSNGYFYVEYSGSQRELELILQSWSGAAEWAKVDAYEHGNTNDRYYAKFSYNDVTKAFGSDFSKLDQLHVSAKNGSITVYSVCWCYNA